MPYGLSSDESLLLIIYYFSCFEKKIQVKLRICVKEFKNIGLDFKCLIKSILLV